MHNVFIDMRTTLSPLALVLLILSGCYVFNNPVVKRPGYPGVLFM